MQLEEFFLKPSAFPSVKESMQTSIMSSLLARTGRHRQRYENNFRLVSGCIPYKLMEEEDQNADVVSRIKVLMISSPDRDDLVFPKGGWEDDETVEQAACREAVEEAGVRGILNKKPLGVWEFRSKSRQNSGSLEGCCRGYMFALEVTEELETWPEQGIHDRKWLNIKEAFRLCRYEWMHRALEEFLRVMEEEKKHETKGVVVNVESASVPVSDVVAECQTMLQNCHVKTSSLQHHEWPTRSSRLKLCIAAGPNLGAVGAAQSSTQLNLKGRA